MEKAPAYSAAPAGIELAALFELSPDIIAVVGFDGSIRRVNPAAVTVSGYTEAELVSADLRLLIHPDDLALVLASIAHLAGSSQGLIIEARGVTKSGELRWFEWNSSRLDDATFIAIGRDVSARRQAELTLRMAGAAMGELAQGYWVRDTLEKTAYWSPELSRLFGLEPHARLTTDPDDFLQCIHPADRERAAREIAEAQSDAACDRLSTQYRIVRPDGAVRHLAVSTTFSRDEQGRHIRSVGTALDVTDKVLTEARLRTEEGLAAAVFDHTGAIMIVLDREGRIVRFNRAAEQLSGWRQEELLGKSWEMLIPEEERARAQELFKDPRAGLFPNTHTSRWLTRDGATVPVTWSNTALCDADGRVEYVIASGVDVSDQERMRTDLLVARRAYRRLLELTFDMVLTIAADGTLLDVNSAGARMFGVRSVEQLAGRGLRDVVHPEYYRAALKELEQTFAMGERRPATEWKLLSVDGRVLEVEVVASISTAWRGQAAVQTLLRDIGDRKLAQSVRNAREHYFESLAKVAPVGIFQTDTEGFVVYANERCTEIVGHADILGTEWQRYIHPADRERVLETGQRALREQNTFSLEYRFVRPEGNTVWVLSQASAQRDNQGHLLGYIGTITDISPFKTLNEELNEAKQRIRRVVDLSFDIIMIVQRDHLLLTDINGPGAALLRGQSLSEFVGRPITNFFEPADRESVRHCIETAFDTWHSSTVRECTLVRRDGTLLEVEGAAIPVMFQDEAAVYMVYRDITERKAAERALRQREHQFETLAKAAPVGIFQTDVHGQCNYANERFLAITGYSYADTEGRKWWEHVVAEDRELVHLHWQDVVNHTGSFELEFRLRRKDGKVIWVLGQAVPEQNDAGENLGFIGSVTDINQGKLDELELRNYREHLEEMVRERTVELEAVNRELESFSYSVSHDLRAPLRAINGFNSALMEEYGNALDDQARFFLRRMQANTRQMSDLIDDLLELSKVTQAELQREEVDLSAVAETVLGELRLTNLDRDVEFDVVPHLSAYGDPHLLQVLMQNLLGNAWKYTSHTPAARIQFGAVDVGGTRAFYVRDNGVGFDMACVPHLFRAFSRLHDSAKFEGTGIGLATVHRVVSRHGGRVWAEAEEGKGATFYFVLH